MPDARAVRSDCSGCSCGRREPSRCTSTTASRRRLRQPKHVRLLPLLPLLLLLLAGCFHDSRTPSLPCVSAREVQVTDEWTLLQENDTVPAGTHVRMDMTTGEKWVKTVSDSHDSHSDGTPASLQSTSTSTSTSAVVVSTDGSVQSHNERDGNDNDSIGKDYHLMYRTLSKLPVEEQQRFGGLPQGNPAGTSMSPEARRIFQQRMDEIWQQRQQELKRIEQEHTVDLPEVLKARIRSIREYLDNNPTQSLVRNTHDATENVDRSNRHSEGDSRDSRDTDTHADNDILPVLEDLEFQLADIDMARDFHTLGGWQLLVSLMSDTVHVSRNLTDRTVLTTPRFLARRSQVQRYAAWAVGTAVKNTGEFTPYALEVALTSTGQNAVDLATNLLVDPSHGLDSISTRQLREKAVYALGSLLRGNPAAQQYFCVSPSSPSATTNAERLADFLTSNSTEGHPKLIKRLLSLVSDVLVDASVNNLSNIDSTVATDCLATTEWCQFASDSLLSLGQPAVDANLVLIPHCEYTTDRLTDMSSVVENMLDASSSNGNDDKEWVSALQKTLQALQSKREAVDEQAV